MAKKGVSLDAVKQIGESAAHHKNEYAPELDKSKIKKKNITYPEFWETELFDKSIKNKAYSGTWQAFIRDAIRERLEKCGIERDDF